MATIKSIEEKAKRYDEALKEAVITHKDEDRHLKATLERIFPELKGSEDERIRKALIKFHKSTIDIDGIKGDDVLAWLEKQGNLMKALQISNAKIGELIEKNYYLKEQLEKQDNNMGISEATKQKVEDNLNKALEKEIPESCNEFLDEQGEQPKKHDVCDNCDQQGSCVSPCPMKLVEKQGEQKPVFEMKTPEESLGIDSDTYNKIVDECIYGEPKPAWSEEDNRMCKAIIDNIKAICEEGYFVGNIDSDELIKWLKSLKERYTWKPSELPHWKKSNLPNDNITGFNSDYFCHKGYNINYKELFEKLPKDD